MPCFAVQNWCDDCIFRLEYPYPDRISYHVNIYENKRIPGENDKFTFIKNTIRRHDTALSVWFSIIGLSENRYNGGYNADGWWL